MSDGELKRDLGLGDCLLLSIGGMVGSAIFVFPGTTGLLVGSAAVLAWAAAGVLMLAIALIYTELTLAFPEAGGPAVYPYETFGGNPTVRAFFSYLEGVSYTLGWTFGITVSALAIADYLAILAPGASGHTVPIALSAIALAFGVNLVGVNVTSRTNLVLSAVVLTVLVAFVGLGLADADPAYYESFLPTRPVRFFAAVQVAITAYGAWTAIPAAAEEIRRPAWTVPRAIVLSILLTTLLYGAVLAALHGVVPADEFVEGTAVVTAPLGAAATAIGLPLFERYLLPLGAVVAIFTTMLVGTLSAGRTLLAMGRKGSLPEQFAAVSSRFQVPWVGLLGVALLAGTMALVPRYFYQLLVISAIVGTGVPYAINIVAFVGLRRYRTDVTPPFRAPGGLALPSVAFLVLGVAMVGLGSTEVAWSLGALALLGSLFVLRYLTAREALLPE